ncbi:NUDIX domain-containing protein [Dendrosporobacter quercicolus]|uniref:NUDIX domain-containing protein n=1 Tax=Dendrosporobacter quercicolus TaxID=146817 RepID=A0A1G9NRK5_9FIRM|nr:NUDIX domain-containing protein [Dendrosporobacter quercicolus]SDL88994.1 NUDIX domain-containing protein [Dendrosporobacter quercicolus]
MSRSIRNSAKALIIKDGKMLAIKLQENGEVWYIMPGGGQETEALLPDAACREVAEELGIRVTPKELVFAVEGVCWLRLTRNKGMASTIDLLNMSATRLPVWETSVTERCSGII